MTYSTRHPAPVRWSLALSRRPRNAHTPTFGYRLLVPGPPPSRGPYEATLERAVHAKRTKAALVPVAISLCLPSP